MLPQGRLAGEHVLSTNLIGMWSFGLVAICFYVIGMNFDWTETIVAQVRSIKSNWFPHSHIPASFTPYRSARLYREGFVLIFG